MSVARVLWPVLVWAGHFTLLYVAASASCGAQGVLTPGAMRWAAWIGTALAVVLALLPVLGRSGDMAPAGQLAAVIAAAAILFNLLPFLLVGGCW